MFGGCTTTVVVLLILNSLSPPLACQHLTYTPLLFLRLVEIGMTLVQVMAVNINLGQYFRFLAAFMPDFTSTQARRKELLKYRNDREHVALVKY